MIVRSSWFTWTRPSCRRRHKPEHKQVSHPNAVTSPTTRSSVLPLASLLKAPRPPLAHPPHAAKPLSRSKLLGNILILCHNNVKIFGRLVDAFGVTNPAILLANALAMSRWPQPRPPIPLLPLPSLVPRL